MKIVIPLAGPNDQFDKYNELKPLIKINGTPIIKICTDSLQNIFNNSSLHLILLKEHVQKYSADKKLREIYSSAKIHIIPELTDGAASTVLKIKDIINDEEDLLVYLADILFEGNIKKSIDTKEANTKGILATFKGEKKKYSYARLNKNGDVEEVAEKKIISDNASAGFYYFTNGRDFVWAAEQMIEKNLRTRNLFFICPVYNQLIERGNKIEIAEVEYIAGLGSPEEIEEYKKNENIRA